MKLTVVGCAGSYPGPDSSASCYLVEADDDAGRTWRLVLELGNGSLGQLHRFVDPLVVDAVLISHHHPDHCGDLNGYYVMRKYHPFRRVGQLPVWGPPDTSQRMCDAYGLPDGEGMDGAFAFRTYPAEPFAVGPFAIHAFDVDHPVPSYGLRLSAGGRTLGYSGDTAVCDGLDAVAADVDLFLAEASFRDGDPNPPHIHLTGVEAGDVATRAGAARMVVTHVPPWFARDDMLAEARTTYRGPCELAVPGAVFEV